MNPEEVEDFVVERKIFEDEEENTILLLGISEISMLEDSRKNERGAVAYNEIISS